MSLAKGGRMPAKISMCRLAAALMLGVIDLIRVSHRARGTERSELSWILEDNRPMRRLIEKFGGRAYKTYRVYEKNLT